MGNPKEPNAFVMIIERLATNTKAVVKHSIVQDFGIVTLKKKSRFNAEWDCHFTIGKNIKVELGDACSTYLSSEFDSLKQAIDWIIRNQTVEFLK